MVKYLSVVIPSEDEKTPTWKKLIFWYIPYKKVLEVCNINMMHLTKNIFINLLGFLGTYGKNKDTLESQEDLKGMNKQESLHPKERHKVQH